MVAGADRRPHNRSVSEHLVRKDELEAAIEARKELGAEMDPAVIDAFVDRIERRLADRVGTSDQALRERRAHQKAMILGSLAFSSPLFLVAAIFAGLAGVIAVSVVLAVIAVVTARSP
jgi:hypothetical protein